MGLPNACANSAGFGRTQHDPSAQQATMALAPVPQLSETTSGGGSDALHAPVMCRLAWQVVCLGAHLLLSIGRRWLHEALLRLQVALLGAAIPLLRWLRKALLHLRLRLGVACLRLHVPRLHLRLPSIARLRRPKALAQHRVALARVWQHNDLACHMRAGQPSLHMAPPSVQVISSGLQLTSNQLPA